MFYLMIFAFSLFAGAQMPQFMILDCNTHTKLKWDYNQEDVVFTYYDISTKEPYTGKCTTFHKNGQKSGELYFINGKLHGLETSWYENGQKFYENNWKEGKAHGLWTMWKQDGRLYHKKVYENGKVVQELY